MRSQEELIETLRTLNEREAALVASLGERLTSPKGQQLRERSKAFHETLSLRSVPKDLTKRSSGDFTIENSGADAFLELLSWYPGGPDGRPTEIGLNLFGDDKIPKDMFDFRREAVELMVGGVLAMGPHKPFDEGLVRPLVNAAAGADKLNTLFRRGLLGKPDPLFDPPLDDYDRLFGFLRDLPQQPCFLGVLHALMEFGRLASWTRAETLTIYHVSANGISALVPNTGYGGTVVKIQGSGFGSAHPAGVSVLFPQAGGSCLSARVLNWSDSEILVEAPESVGHGYVGLSRRDPPEPVSTNVSFSAGAELAGVLENCVGPAASRVSDRLTHWLPTLRSPGCAPALSNNANYFRGGPEIITVSPENVRQGDQVTVKGNLFAFNDIVLVGGQMSATTFVSANELRFTMPSVYGGVQYVRVRHSPNHLSNQKAVQMIPVIFSANGWRAKPGSFVSLTGSGFAPGSSVRVNDEETGAMVTSPNSLGFGIFRPKLIMPDKRGEPVDLQVVLPSGGTSNKIRLLLDTYHIVTFGDSIIWGQGLEEQQKFSTLVRNYVQVQLGGKIGVYLDICAHSGAPIGPKLRKPSSDLTLLPALPGEVPTSDPTIYQQVDAWNATSGNALLQGEVDLILMDGGINDIGIPNLLNPLSFLLIDIKDLAVRHCHDAMKELLMYVAATFPKARIIVTGYYRIISEQSDPMRMANFLALFGIVLANIPGALVAGGISWGAMFSIVTNCKVFATEANRQLQLAVDEVNAALGGNSRIFLALPAFGPQNAALAPASWLWQLDGVFLQDPLANSRATECSAAGARTEFYCPAASLGHPNPAGARVYFEAIKPLLNV